MLAILVGNSTASELLAPTVPFDKYMDIGENTIVLIKENLSCANHSKWPAILHIEDFDTLVYIRRSLLYDLIEEVTCAMQYINNINV